LLGPAGAVRLLKAMRSEPDSSAKKLFPDAARTNRPLFFNGDGKALSVKQFYDNMERRWNAGLDVLTPRVAQAKDETQNTEG
jgi:hypothetical protein